MFRAAQREFFSHRVLAIGPARIKVFEGGAVADAQLEHKKLWLAGDRRSWYVSHRVRVSASV